MKVTPLAGHTGNSDSAISVAETLAWYILSTGAVKPTVESMHAAAEGAWNQNDFALAFAWDGACEEAGMHADNRFTCWTHRVWADDEHLNNAH